MTRTRFPARPARALSCVVLLCCASARAQEEAPPTPVVPLQEGVRLPAEPLTLRPGDIALPFALPDAGGNLISSRAWLTQRALLVLSLSDPAPLNPDDAPAQLAPSPPNAPLSPEQVLAARRVAEAVQGAAPRLQKSGVAVVVIAGEPYFSALRDALGADFKAATVPEVIEPSSPNVFLLRDDLPLAQAVPAQLNAPAAGSRRVRWSELAGRSESGVVLTALDLAGFVRLNEGVTDLLNLGALLASTGEVSPQVAIGQPAPDFSIRDDDGRVRRLSDLRGQKNLMLTFFPKCFTGG